MFDDKIKTRLNRVLNDLITGEVSLKTRKMLATGSPVRVTIGQSVFVVSVEGEHAAVRHDRTVVLSAPFVLWSQIDDDYEAMIASFGEDGCVDEDWFQKSTNNYQSRFDELK